MNDDLAVQVDRFVAQTRATLIDDGPFEESLYSVSHRLQLDSAPQSNEARGRRSALIKLLITALKRESIETTPLIEEAFEEDRTRIEFKFGSDYYEVLAREISDAGAGVEVLNLDSHGRVSRSFRKGLDEWEEWEDRKESSSANRLRGRSAVAPPDLIAVAQDELSICFSPIDTIKDARIKLKVDPQSELRKSSLRDLRSREMVSTERGVISKICSGITPSVLESFVAETGKVADETMGLTDYGCLSQVPIWIDVESGYRSSSSADRSATPNSNKLIEQAQSHCLVALTVSTRGRGWVLIAPGARSAETACWKWEHVVEKIRSDIGDACERELGLSMQPIQGRPVYDPNVFESLVGLLNDSTHGKEDPRRSQERVDHVLRILEGTVNANKAGERRIREQRTVALEDVFAALVGMSLTQAANLVRQARAELGTVKFTDTGIDEARQAAATGLAVLNAVAAQRDVMDNAIDDHRMSDYGDPHATVASSLRLEVLRDRLLEATAELESSYDRVMRYVADLRSEAQNKETKHLSNIFAVVGTFLAVSGLFVGVAGIGPPWVEGNLPTADGFLILFGLMVFICVVMIGLVLALRKVFAQGSGLDTNELTR